jgi:hypothetical protein
MGFTDDRTTRVLLVTLILETLSYAIVFEGEWADLVG